MRISVEKYQELHKEHVAGATLREISDKHNLRLATLWYGFTRLGLPVTKNPGRPAVGVVHHDYFDVIDTQEKAYYLGLLMSDGWISFRKKVTRSPRVCLKLHEADKYLVERLRDILQPQASLSKDSNSYRVEVISDQLVQALQSHGLVERKTVNGKGFPDLGALQRHFIRGYFDGDGSISTAKRNKSTIYVCAVDRSFLVRLQDHLQKEGIKSTIHTEKRDHLGYRDMYTLHINSRTKFHSFIYKDATVLMTRKKLIYDHVNTVLTAKEAAA